MYKTKAVIRVLLIASLFFVILQTERKVHERNQQNRTTTTTLISKDRYFQNDEVRIFFPNNEFEKQDITTQNQSGYFDAINTRIRFCAVYIPKSPEVQYVNSSDGWLCELDVLPAISIADVEQEIVQKFGDSYSTVTNIGSEQVDGKRLAGVLQRVINGFDVLQWRHEIGKTRLEYSLVFGKKHNYLLISSPYGDGATIESIIQKIQML